MIKTILFAILFAILSVSATQAQDNTPQAGELVTNAQFAAFIPLLDYNNFPADLQVTPPSGVPINDQPFRIATWHEANAFCEYYRLELPSAEQLKEVDRRAEVNEWLQADERGKPGYNYLNEDNEEKTTYQTFLFAENIMFRCVEVTGDEAELDCETIEAWFAEQDMGVVGQAYAGDCERINEDYYQPAIRQQKMDELAAENLDKVKDCNIILTYGGPHSVEDLFQERLSRLAQEDKITYENFPWFGLVLSSALDTEGATFCAIAAAMVNDEIDFGINYEIDSAIPAIKETLHSGNFRSTPLASGTANIIQNIDANEEVYVLAEVGDWYLVDYWYTIGFMHEVLFQDKPE